MYGRDALEQVWSCTLPEFRLLKLFFSTLTYYISLHRIKTFAEHKACLPVTYHFDLSEQVRCKTYCVINSSSFKQMPSNTLIPLVEHIPGFKELC